jgi:hypothetical protein
VQLTPAVKVTASVLAADAVRDVAVLRITRVSPFQQVWEDFAPYRALKTELEVRRESEVRP